MSWMKPADVPFVLSPWYLLEAFRDLPDPRREHLRYFDLSDVLVLSLVGVICGCDSWTDIADFGACNLAWFQEHGVLRNGAPSHDTLGRVFRRLDHRVFGDCFGDWVGALAGRITGVVAIDGKTLRGSSSLNGTQAVHTLCAWAASSQLTLGMLAVEAKENEIVAIPRLLALLDLKGCIVTIDAMGCQKSIAQNILDCKADYLLALKKNQPSTHADVETYCQEAAAHGWYGIDHDADQSSEHGHGRTDKRRVTTYPITGRWIANHGWPRAKQIICVESTRTYQGKTTTEQRYYLTSSTASAEILAGAIRDHWGIENSMHYVLDVTFGEDASRVRCDHAAKNFATIRRMALNMLRNAPNPPVNHGLKETVSIRRRRKIARWRQDYLLQILAQAGVSLEE